MASRPPTGIDVADRQTNQHVARVGDAGICHQPIQVLLTQSHADCRRTSSTTANMPSSSMCRVLRHPTACQLSVAPLSGINRSKADETHDLRDIRQQGRVGRGRSLKHIRRVEVKRHRRDAEAQSGQQQARMTISSIPSPACGGRLESTSRIAAKFVVPATPYSQLMPYSTSAEEKMLSRKYLSVASPPVRSRRGKYKNHVGRDADQFERQKQRDQIVRGGHQARSRQDRQQTGKGFGRMAIVDLIPQHEHQQDAGRKRQPAHVPHQRVDVEQRAFERSPVPP